MQLSQRDSAATIDVCNQLLGTLDRMKDTVIELSRHDPNTNTLRLISGLLAWCDDARHDVVEIKSYL